MSRSKQMTRYYPPQRPITHGYRRIVIIMGLTLILALMAVTGLAGMLIGGGAGTSISVSAESQIVNDRSSAVSTSPETESRDELPGTVQEQPAPQKEEPCPQMRKGEVLFLKSAGVEVKTATDGTVFTQKNWVLSREVFCAVRQVLRDRIDEARRYEKARGDFVVFSYGYDQRNLFVVAPSTPLKVKEVSSQWCTEVGLTDPKMLVYGTTNCLLWYRIFLRERPDFSRRLNEQYKSLLVYQDRVNTFEPKIRTDDFGLLGIQFIRS